MNKVGNFYQVLFLENKYLGMKANDEIVYSQIKELCALVLNALLIENFFFTNFGDASIRVSTVYVHRLNVVADENKESKKEKNIIFFGLKEST